MKFLGRIISGRGEGAFFTKLDWVVEQCRTKLGFIPFPGTLNLKLGLVEIATVEQLLLDKGIILLPPTEEFCEAKCLPVIIKGISAALVFPIVMGRCRQIVEIIAPIKLRDALDLEDGDIIAFDILMAGPVIGLAIPKAIMFDLDGTLIDTVKIYIRIVNEAWHRLGLPLPQEDILLNIIRTAGRFRDYLDQLLPQSILDKEMAKQQCQEALLEVREELYHKEARTVEGAKETLIALDKSAIMLAVVTSSGRIGDALMVLNRQGINPNHLFKEIVTRNDVRRLKPNPDPISLCLERLGCNPGDCLYVGDSPIDIIAGRAAGTKTVAVLTGAGTIDDLKKVSPDFILNSIRGLPTLFGIG